MATNTWQIGVPYSFRYQGGGADFWTQPDGPGTQVYPQEQLNNIWPDWPGAATLTINEVPVFGLFAGCGHGFNSWKVLQEYDNVKEQPVQLLVCPLCQYVQRAVYGADQNGMPLLYDPNLYVVIVG